jgi:hypothetical protein
LAAHPGPKSGRPIRIPWPYITVGEDPRPVPWVRDLGLLSAAVAAVSQFASADIARNLRQHLLEAAQEITKDSGASVQLRDVELPTR